MQLSKVEIPIRGNRSPICSRQMKVSGTFRVVSVSTVKQLPIIVEDAGIGSPNGKANRRGTVAELEPNRRMPRPG